MLTKIPHQHANEATWKNFIVEFKQLPADVSMSIRREMNPYQRQRFEEMMTPPRSKEPTLEPMEPLEEFEPEVTLKMIYKQQSEMQFTLNELYQTQRKNDTRIGCIFAYIILSIFLAGISGYF